MDRKIKVLVAKPGLDGHDRGAKIVARSLRDAGMEVIYSGLHQTPEQIVEVALQEDVDVLGLSIHSGAHLTLFPKIINLLRKKTNKKFLIVAGGIIPEDDKKILLKKGVAAIFGPGTNTQEIVKFINEEMKKFKL